MPALERLVSEERRPSRVLTSEHREKVAARRWKGLNLVRCVSQPELLRKGMNSFQRILKALLESAAKERSVYSVGEKYKMTVA